MGKTLVKADGKVIYFDILIESTLMFSVFFLVLDLHFHQQEVREKFPHEA